ncbi:MmyB family transcriptional regulator, partial [Nocardia gipuzkoensis]
ERNKRPITQSVLVPMLEALGVDPSQAQAFTDLYANSHAPRHDDQPLPHEVSALEAISTPACYLEVRGYRVMATNAALRRQIPGLTPGTTFIEWLMLDPNARVVCGNWEEFTHLFVYSLRQMAASVIEPQAFESIIRSCSRAPEWERMWNTRPDEYSVLPVLIQVDPATGASHRV